MTTCNFACWIVSRPRTCSGRDWDSRVDRLLSRSSSELESAESFFLALSVSFDMTVRRDACGCDTGLTLLYGSEPSHYTHHHHFLFI